MTKTIDTSAPVEVFDHGGRPCPGCGVSQWRKGPRLPAWPALVRPSPLRLIECALCGSAHLPPVMLEDYSSNAPVTVESARSHIAKATRSLETLYPTLRRHLRLAKPRALVIGCSTGYEIDALLTLPIEFSAVDGLESNRQAVELARMRFASTERVTIRHGNMEDLEEAYDLIVITMVLEHLMDPYIALQAVASQQAEGGLVAIQVPRYDNRIPRSIRGRLWYYVMEAHLWYFTKQGLVSLLHRHGYEVLGIFNAPRYATLSFAFDKVFRAILRQIGPYFIRHNSGAADWDRLGQWADKTERVMERIAEKGERSGLGIATKCFKMGFLNDAMTALARKKAA